ncbi:hypothetical protein QFC19_001564 [Naganishia cerealis]|uniref:Uncharacterized protein n=1 Tax=Naganishia cerealis TaxID=610337 RepID=A0ACC2WFC4_9TREE|nr:hypothetical protein QFC19_001564 [Naganishia cerealis]
MIVDHGTRLSRPVYRKRQDEQLVVTGRGRKKKFIPLPVTETTISQSAYWTYSKNREAYDSDDSLDEEYRSAIWKPLHEHVDSSEDYRPQGRKRQAPSQPRARVSSGLNGAVSASGNKTLVGKTDSSNSNGSYNQQDYDTILGYDMIFLSNLLAPQRSVCNKRFELSIDDLTFLGHPVRADKDGKWVMLDDEEEIGEGGQEEERGRSGRAKKMFSAGPPIDLEVVKEGEVAHTPATRRQSQHSQAQDGDATDEANKTLENEPQAGPQLQLFSLVLVIDKPDPAVNDELPYLAYDTLYREVILPWTAAAFLEQVRTGWVAEESKKLVSVRDHALEKLIPLKKAQADAFEVSPLAMSLKTVYQNINRKTTAHIYVGEEALDIRVPAKPPAPSEEWTRWGEDVSEESDDQSETSLEDDYASQLDDEVDFTPAELRMPALKPWKALIRIDNTVSLWEDTENEHNYTTVTDIPFQRMAVRSTSQERPAVQPELAMSSVDTYAEDPLLERDIRELSEPLVRLLSSLDPMLPMYVLAENLGLDLENELYVLARYLISTDRARLVDAVRPSLRNIFMPNTTTDRSRLFPANATQSDREEYTRALYWLLAHDLVIQAHEYVRIIATAKMKSRALQDLREEKENKKKRRKERRELREAQAQAPIQKQKTPITGTSMKAPDPLTHPPELTTDSSDDSDREFGNKDGEDYLSNGIEAVIERPGRPSSGEARCLKMMTQEKEENWQKKFNICAEYFNGRTSIEEMQYKTGLDRRDIRQVLNLFKEEVRLQCHAKPRKCAKG